MFCSATPLEVLFLPFGSRVYGTALPDSDHDFIALILHGEGETGQEHAHDGLNLQTWRLDDYQRALAEHDIVALEVYFAPNSPLPALCPFTLSRTTLRHALSQKASHSFVKAKKKIAVEQDYRTGWKSLFHSLRILTFGIELAQTENLTNFAAANTYWDELWTAQETDWETLQARWQPTYNALATEFRRLAPKA